MQLDLTRYRQPLTHFSKVFQPEELGQESDAYRIVAPVQVEMDIHKDKDRFRLEGTARTELELTCSRCLEPYRLPFDAAFDLRYLPASEASDDGERQVGHGVVVGVQRLQDSVHRRLHRVMCPQRSMIGDKTHPASKVCG